MKAQAKQVEVGFGGTSCTFFEVYCMRICAFLEWGWKTESEEGRQVRHNEADEMSCLTKIPMKVWIYKNLGELGLIVDHVTS